MTKRVGILSMQRIRNYGSFLQAYGLKHLLEQIGCEVQFVDYHPGDLLGKKEEAHGPFRFIKKAFEAISYGAPLIDTVRYIKYKKNYESNYFPLLGITKERNYYPKLDLLIIGSDEVFNCTQSNTDVGFSPDLFGNNHNATKLISYAASFGNTTLQSINKYKIDELLSTWLSRFDCISVRDNNSMTIVDTLIGKKPYTHLDPVLVYDFNNELSSYDKIVDNNYLVLYGYSGRFSKKECKEIECFAKKHNLSILCVGGIQKCCDSFIDLKPLEVISCFRNAKYVITDTFHGTILSIITHRPFVSIVRESGYGNKQKIDDLLERLNLRGRELLSIEELGKKLEESIDYSITDNIIQEERKKAIDYLKQWID